MGMSEEAWQRANRILLIRLDSMGDVLMTEPAFRAVRESRPGAHIALLTSPSGANAAAMMPEIDTAVVYHAPWMKNGGYGRGELHDAALIRYLRTIRFDAAIIFTVYSQSSLPAALLAYLSGIPLRLAHARENPYRLLTHWVKEIEPELLVRHEVRRQLDLVAEVGFMVRDKRIQVRIRPEHRASALRILRERGVDLAQGFMVVHPGATAASRRYAPEKFAEAMADLHRRHGAQLVLSGSASELPLLRSIEQACGVPVIRLTGLRTPVFAAVLQLSRLLISNNTGPVHLAAAVGTPIIDLYALTNPQHTPWQVPHRLLFHDVPCRNCYRSVCPEGHHRCLQLVEPRQVVDAAMELMTSHVDTGH
jgi:lipopolysaccharide heptosyltransferase II